MKLPSLVVKLCMVHNAWVVGSGAKPELNDLPRDWDVAVPYSQWLACASLIPKESTPNSFGGWKCKSDGATIDVWPDDLSKLLTNGKMTYAWHPQTGVRWVKQNKVTTEVGVES